MTGIPKSNEIQLEKKLFLVYYPIKGLAQQSVIKHTLTEVSQLFPKEDEVFEGKYNYKFIVVPSIDANNIEVVNISNMQPEKLENISKKIDKILKENNKKNKVIANIYDDSKVISSNEWMRNLETNNYKISYYG